MLKHNRALLNNFRYFIQTEKGLSKNTIVSYVSDIESFLVFCNKSFNNVSNSDFVDFFVSLQKIGVSSNSLSRKKSSIKSFITFLLEEGLKLTIELEKLPQIKHSKNLPLALSTYEMKKMLEFYQKPDALSVRNRAILEFMYATGTRVSEVINLSEHDIYWDDKLIRVLGKGSKQRYVPILETSISYLKNYIQSSRAKLLKTGQTDILFLNRFGRKLSRMGMWKIIEKAARESFIKKEVSPHTIRHTFATHLLEGGANLRVIQILLGHTSINTTQIYTNIDTKYIVSVHKKYHPRARR